VLGVWVVTLRYLSLFSGIEAASAAWAGLGWQCVGVSEIEPFPSRVLASHHPHVPNLGDVTKITEEQVAALGQIDLVVFGSPCQDLSVAGRRKGLDGARSGLFFTAMQIIEWARTWGGCRFALWENVPGAFSSNKGLDFAVVVDWLAGLDGTEPPPKGWGSEGCAVGTEAMVEWSTLDAQWFGVAQRRRRVFALADFGDWARRPPLLLEPESLRGDSAPSRGAGETVAPTLAAGANGGGPNGPGRDVDTAESLVVEPRSVLSSTGDVSHCLNAGGMGRIDYETETMIVCATGERTHALRADGFDASEDGTGRGTPIVASGVRYAHYSHDYAGDRLTDPVGVAPALTAASTACGGLNVAIGFHHNAQACQLPGPDRDTSVSDSLTCSQQAAVAFDTYNQTTSGVAHALRNPNGTFGDALPAVFNGMQVRRLTPRECERLQGFPDGHTAIQNAKDGPRYKALGNSMAVPVMRWIGQRIDFVWRWF
jgi:DNA (cytosine-5)-methyltransferase 1